MTDVPALRQGLAVLRRLAERDGSMSASALAHELNLPRSTTYHLLAEMRLAGAVEHHQVDQQWALGPLVAVLSEAYRRTHPPTDEPAAGDPPADSRITRSTTPS